MLVQVFHRAVYAPPRVFKSPGVVKLFYTQHARAAAQGDKYGNLTRHLRHTLDFDAADIVEVELVDGVVTKRTLRLAVTDELALVMVVSAEGRVITVWGNRLVDDHASLDLSKFVPAPKTNSEPAAELAAA